MSEDKVTQQKHEEEEEIDLGHEEEEEKSRDTKIHKRRSKG